MATDNTKKAKYAGVLIRPRITEKANLVVSKNIHTFEIAEKYGKKDVVRAVKAFYNVTPKRVNITKNPSKKVFVRGKFGNKGGVKKAYVYLKEGDKIE